ncbi:MAG: cell division protein [Sphingomonadales bacterium]
MTAAADAQPRKVLPEGRFSGPMPWVIAIMIFLAVLAAAAGLSMGRATGAIAGAIAGRITVQIVEANPDVRTDKRARLARALRTNANVTDVSEVGDAEMRNLLAPWLGADGLEGGLPVPALIDASLKDSSSAAMASIGGVVRGIDPHARIDRHADWMGPLNGLLHTLKWLAIALVGVTGAAAAAAVILGSRAAMDQHRATIDVMHLMGATDVQISRLFERRVAQDAISGSALGFVTGMGVLIIVGQSVQAVGAGLVTNATLGWIDWLLVLVIPFAGVGLAILSARITVMRALARIL